VSLSVSLTIVSVTDSPEASHAADMRLHHPKRWTDDTDGKQSSSEHGEGMEVRIGGPVDVSVSDAAE